MKPIYKYKKINGQHCIFYANEKGGMWFGVINDKPCGAHGRYEGSSDLKEHIDVLQQNAKEMISHLINKKTL